MTELSVSNWKGLGLKLKVKNHEWQFAWDHAEELVPASQLDLLIDKTRKEARQVLAGKRAVYGWSGGKDSQALQILMEGIVRGSLFVATQELEYPCIDAWVAANAPPGLTQVRTPQTWDWLVKNPDMLFAHERDGSKWYSIVQWRGHDEFCKKNKIDVLVLGRRTIEGNHCGTAETQYCTRKGDRITYNPMARWSHEAVLALVKRSGMKLAPFYTMPEGWVVGSHSWPGHMFKEEDHPSRLAKGWDRIKSVDHSIFDKAKSLGLPGTT